MRVTENHLATQYLNNVQNTRQRVADLQSKIASGKRVLKPSDDPRATDGILRFQALLEANEQYQRSNADGQSFLQATSETLGSISDSLLGLKGLLVRANNSANIETLPSFATSADAILGDLVDMANTRFNGKYIFGGTNTLERPFTLDAARTAVTANPNGIDGIIAYPVGEGITQQSNIPGDEAFQGTTLFDTIIRIRDAMAAGTIPTAADIDEVSAQLDYMLTKAGKAGMFVNTMTANEAFLASQETQLRSLLSIEQDTDVAEAITEMKRGELMLDAALNTMARILPKSLLDFLR
ncbi:MAG: flagellar hook-associated protein FlgL [Bacteroidetes bacterium]|nr:flagellar hook-associated protein FlgL [Bacteroidota bacterium]